MACTLYDILQIQRNASSEGIKAAFRKLALIHHPDKNNNSPESKVSFISIHNAYEILVDPEKRREYDDYLAISSILQGSFSPATGKNAYGRSSGILPGTPGFSADVVLGHINILLWDIEIFIRDNKATVLYREVEGKSIREYVLMILTFIDAWILEPGGFPDYFMEARKKKRIPIFDYIRLISSGRNRSGHIPFVSLTDYFYNIRKRCDKFLNNTGINELYTPVPDTPFRLLDCVIEARQYGIHYLLSIRKVLSGDIMVIEPFRFSDPGFEVYK